MSVVYTNDKSIDLKLFCLAMITNFLQFTVNAGLFSQAGYFPEQTHDDPWFAEQQLFIAILEFRLKSSLIPSAITTNAIRITAISINLSIIMN